MGSDIKYDIFISYSRTNRNVIDPFVQQLESLGYNVWIDRTGVYSGTRFKSVLVQAIEDSEILLFFSSKDANASPWTAKEIAIAVDRQKTIIPIKLDDSRYNREVEFDLINLDFVDLSNKSNIDQEYGKLMRTLESIFGKTQTETPQQNFSTTSKNANTNYTKNNQKEIALISFMKNNRGCAISVAIMSLLLIVAFPIFFRTPSYAPSAPNEPSTIESRNTILLEDETTVNPNNFTHSVAAEPQLIDLGLPSGTLWLDRNLGASSPDDPGMYLAWGELEEKDEYCTETYFNKTSFEGLDGKQWLSRIIKREISGSQYDAATKIMGAEYRMPTRDDMKELIKSCSWQYGHFNDQPGYKVTGPNGDYIFLPACGSKVGLSIHTGEDKYWTSTVTDENPCILSLKGYEVGEESVVQRCDLSYTLEEWGLPIRPVSKNSSKK